MATRSGVKTIRLNKEDLEVIRRLRAKTGIRAFSEVVRLALRKMVEQVEKVA